MKQFVTASLILNLVSTSLTGCDQSSRSIDRDLIGSGPVMAQQTGIKRTELQRYDLSARGREVIQVRIDFDPGTEFGRHSHPGEEIIYVIEGLLEYKVEGKSPVTLRAGEVLFIPAGTIHAAKNVGSSNAAELATYIVEKGKPLISISK